MEKNGQKTKFLQCGKTAKKPKFGKSAQIYNINK